MVSGALWPTSSAGCAQTRPVPTRAPRPGGKLDVQLRPGWISCRATTVGSSGPSEALIWATYLIAVASTKPEGTEPEFVTGWDAAGPVGGGLSAG